MVVLFIFMNIALTAGSVAWSGSLGGSIAGLFWGMATFPRAASRGGEKQRLFGSIFPSFFFVLFGYLFFTADES